MAQKVSRPCSVAAFNAGLNR